MFGVTPSSERAPLFYIGDLAVFFSTLLVIVHAVAMVVWAILGNARAFESILPWLGFSADSSFIYARLWQFVTYILVNPPSLGLLVSMIFLYIWGREVEKFFGRKVFIKIYLILLIGVPVVFTILHYLFGGLFGWSILTQTLLSTGSLSFVFFLAFAFIYPNVLLLFGFKAKWVAAVFIGIITLIYLADRDWFSFFTFWTEIILCYGSVRYYGITSRFPRFESAISFGRWGDDRRERRKRRKKRPGSATGAAGRGKKAGPARASGPTLKPRADIPAADEEVKSIDHLLDKISAHGFASLSEKEKELLSKASNKLKKKPKKH